MENIKEAPIFSKKMHVNWLMAKKKILLVIIIVSLRFYSFD